MSVEATIGRTRYEGNGSAVEFPVGFSFAAAEDVRAVWRRNSPTVPGAMEDVELTLDVDFTLTGDGEAGEGVVRFAPGGAPLPAGETLTIVLSVPLTQERSWSNADAVDVREIEKADDKLTRICQQLKEEVGRCVKVAVTSDSDPDDYLADTQNARGEARAAAASAVDAQTGAEAARADLESALETCVGARDESVQAQDVAQSAQGAAEAARDAAQQMPAVVVQTADEQATRIVGVGDTQTGRVQDEGAAQTAGIEARVQELLAVLQKAGGMPVGVVLPYGGGGVPDGYLPCQGAEVSRTAYAALFETIGTTFGEGDGSTTFNVPDTRGVVLRGVDDGRGLDAGRELGTYQGDEIKSHSHSYVRTVARNGNSFFRANTSGSSIRSIYDANHPTSGAGGAETRMKNLAVRHIIKY